MLKFYNNSNLTTFEYKRKYMYPKKYERTIRRFA